MDINEITASRIREIRNQKGFTVEAVADVLNLTKGAYSNLENGKVGITLTKLDKLAHFFNVPLNELIGSGSSNQQTYNGDHGLNNNYSHNNTFNNFFANNDNLEKAIYIIKEALKSK